MRIVGFGNGDLHRLLAALGAAEPIVQEADHAVGGGVQAQRIDAGCDGGITDADHQRDQRHHHHHLDESDAGHSLTVAVQKRQDRARRQAIA